MKWPRAAGPFLQAVKLEGRLLVHRHIQKIQGPLSLEHAHHQVSSWASQREAKPPLHLLSESVH